MKVWVDGSGALLVEQIARICVVFENSKTIEKEIGKKTNNEAEYMALIEALKDKDCKNCTIYSDSQLVVGHLTKGWKRRSKNLYDLYSEASTLMHKKNCKVEWIARGKNKAGKILEKK